MNDDQRRQAVALIRVIRDIVSHSSPREPGTKDLDEAYYTLYTHLADAELQMLRITVEGRKQWV